MAWSQQQIDSLGGGNPAVTPNQASNAYSNSNQFVQNLVPQTQQQEQQPSPFSSPLQNIASGNSQANVQTAIGAGKQAVSDILGAGADSPNNPNSAIGKVNFANAPAFAKDVEGLDQAVIPSNPQQQQGAMNTTVAEAAIPLGEGGAAVEKGMSDLAAKSAEAKATKTAIKALTPKMTAGEMSEAAAAGKGVVPKIGAPGINMAKDSGFMKMVDAVKGLVKGKSPIEDINSVRGALSTEAEALKSKIVASGKDLTYDAKDLASKIDSAEEPISLKGTPFEKQVAPIKQAAIQIAQKAGNTVSSLLDARKGFDALVDKTYPNLWDKENAPMRNAVSAVRNAMNDFLEEKLPDAGYKSSLETQRTFYNAIDNLSTKVPDEIKGNATWTQRHPVIGGALKVGAGFAGADAMNQTAKNLGLPSF